MELNFNLEHIRRANDQSMTGRAGDAIVSDARAALAHFAVALPAPDTLEEAQRAYYERRASEWPALVQEAYADALRRRANFVPWYVAGPSNYPAAKANRQTERDMNARSEYDRKMDAFIENTRKEIARLESPARQIERYRRGQTSDAVQMGDPFAIEKLAARLEYLKETQEHMRRVNAYWRKHHTCQGCEGISAENAKRLDESAAGMYGAPYAPFELSNNLQNIHRIEARLQELETIKARADQQPSTELEADSSSFMVVENAEAARLQILFDDIPPAEARELLKGNGFRWSPRAGAWQRQLTPNAISALRRIKNELIELLKEE